jgi:FKBP-type peptidyl-prolyl cis-trans isomerase
MSFHFVRRNSLIALSLAALPACAPTFMERAAAEPGAARLPSGSVLRSLHPGDGAVPHDGDRVRVAWEGRFVDGTLFTASRTEGGAHDFTFGSASPCWREAMAKMHVGEKARVVCAPDSAKGEEGPKVPANTTVTFELELLVPGTGDEVELPPGLVLKTTAEGTGDHPRANDQVKVHYEGRLADGTVFDSSLKRGEPAEFPLSGVIPCWRLALQKMRVGEKAQLTCPPEIAYGKKGSPPSIPPNATLTFDVELIAIIK